MPAPTLTSIAQRACVRALPNITEVSDIPYELLRPVLKKIINPAHLREIEQNSPHIGDADAELWRAFIARDIPNWREKMLEPKNPRSWGKVYRKLIREEERAKEEQEAQLAAAMSGIKQEKDANRAQYVQKVIPQGSSRGKAFIDGQPNPAASTGWGGIRVPSLKNAKRGPDALAAIRKQSSQAAKDKGIYKRQDTFNHRMGPTNGRSQIKAAPDWMIREKTKPAPGPTAVPARAEAQGRVGQQGQGVFTGKREPTARDRALDQAVRSSNAEREARLRALTGAKPGGGAASPPSTAAARNVTTATGARRGASGASGNYLEASAARPSPAVASQTNKPANPTPPAAGIVRKRPAAGASPFMPAKRVKR
ncbi:hypothetical protein KC357_g2204 [Hortaea werneckii]|nr:hypothetical protein KC357_g2204 [Hortaea werneckii]